MDTILGEEDKWYRRDATRVESPDRREQNLKPRRQIKGSDTSECKYMDKEE